MTVRAPARIRLAALALAALAGCRTSEKIEGTRFQVELGARGTAKRFLSVDCAHESAGGRRGVEIVDVTTIDDDAGARRVLRIEPAATPGDPRPGSGHVDFATVAVRPIDLVIRYRGHSDLYHLTFPHDGGVLVEPLEGEFTRVAVRTSR